MDDTPITLLVDGAAVSVAPGTTVVAAIAIAGHDGPPLMRRSVVGELRGPLCGMGICQECRVAIDGVSHRLACQTVCEQGMSVCTEGRMA